LASSARSFINLRVSSNPTAVFVAPAARIFDECRATASTRPIGVTVR